MTLREATKLVGVVQAMWPRWPLAKDTPDVWYPLLAGFELADAEAAVRELAAEGREQAPPVGVIVKAIADRATDLPEWDEALDEIERALRTYRLPPGTIVSDESELRPAPPADYWSSPVLAAFMAGSWDEWRRVSERDRRTFLAQQRDAYKALRSRAQRDVGLIAIGAPRRSTLRRVQALRQLPGLTTARHLLDDGGTP